MRRLYIIDKMWWVLIGFLLTLGISMLIYDVMFGIIPLALALMWGTRLYEMDKKMGYTTALYNNWLRRRGRNNEQIKQDCQGVPES